MSYGLKYISSVSTTDPSGAPNNTLAITIWQKDYTGDHNNVIAAASPVIHKWNEDDPKAAIKGSFVELRLVNTGFLPLTNFYSIRDDEFLVKVEIGGYDVFTGYIVQDDCREEMVDHNHVIVLSATDNLGLLKDIPLNEAAKLYGPTNSITGVFDSLDGDLIGPIPPVDIEIGDTLIITNTGTVSDGQYTVKLLDENLTRVRYSLEPEMPSAFSSVTINIQRIRPFSLTIRRKLSEIFALCLSATNLRLDTNVYVALKPNDGDVDRMLEDVLISPETFLNGETWENCYNVLSAILERLNACFFQALNVWNIVRWEELRGYENEIPRIRYDADFNFLSATGTLPDAIDFGYQLDTYPEAGMVKSIFRPFKYAKETFNYKTPSNVLKNANFSEVGPLIAEYADGDNTIREYEMKWWEAGFTWPFALTPLLVSNAERFIRVTYDEFDNEIARIGVIRGASGLPSQPHCAASYPIEVNKGDVIELSFSFKTSNAQSGVITNVFSTNIIAGLPLAPRNPNNLSLALNSATGTPDGGWVQGPGGNIVYQTLTGDNTENWHTVTVRSLPITFDGILYVQLGQASYSFEETHYKDIRLDIYQYINDSTKVIGHTHTQRQPPFIKNNEDVEIKVDDSPRNSIAGTFFLPSFGPILQNRVQTWTRGGLTEERKLGYITTLENLFWRRQPRTMYDGSIYGILRDSVVSALSVMTHDGSNMVWGTLEIDYANNKATGTLWEIYRESEVGIGDGDLLNSYEFKYLYESGESTR